MFQTHDESVSLTANKQPPARDARISGEYVVTDDLTFCFLGNMVAHAGKLRDFTDNQIANGLCMVTKDAVQAIWRNDPIKEQACMQVAEMMALEFKRRFPNLELKSVVGRC